jgi:phage terminase Nu1 subunit (DNA packaging protein)
VESLAEAQRRVALQREIKLDLENRLKQGQLVDAAQCRREFFEAGRTFREAMLGIPDRFASQLAAEKDRAKVHQMLDEAIRTALERLAERFEAEVAVAQ